MKEFNIKLDYNKNNFQLMVLGDMHIGDENCDMEMIEKAIDYVKSKKDCYVILNGDLINNALKTSKSDTYKETMSIEDEQDLLIELLTPIKNKILVMATGNHENRTNLLSGINPLKAVAHALGIRDKLTDNSYLLNIEFGKYHSMGNRHNKCVIFGIHGGTGGGRRIGSTANALQDMALIRPDMDLYIHSHTHNNVSYSDMVFLYDKKTKKTKEHRRFFYNANAFLKYGGYAEQKGYRPTDRTPNVITVNAVGDNGSYKILINTIKI